MLKKNIERELQKVSKLRKQKMKEYLDLRRKSTLKEGVGRELDELREKEHKLKLKLIDLKLKSVGELSDEKIKLKSSKAKLLSKLDHDEWLEFTRSVWRFKEVESNVKTGVHPAQFSAVIPYRCIKMYSFVGDTVLDPMVGVGTTLVEAKRLRRKSIGVDINFDIVKIAKENTSSTNLKSKNYNPIIKKGDARNLSFISNNTIDLIILHPPYFNAIKISRLKDDLSNFENNQYDKFLGEMKKVFSEMRRVLKNDRVLAIFTGDVMRKVDGETKTFPLHSDYIQILTNMQFSLWDTFIVETKIKKKGGKPMMGSYPYPHKLFSQFAHNYLLIFRKR